MSATRPRAPLVPKATPDWVTRVFKEWMVICTFKMHVAYCPRTMLAPNGAMSEQVQHDIQVAATKDHRTFQLGLESVEVGAVERRRREANPSKPIPANSMA
jgi:hypothetical protein